MDVYASLKEVMLGPFGKQMEVLTDRGISKVATQKAILKAFDIDADYVRRKAVELSASTGWFLKE